MSIATSEHPSVATALSVRTTLVSGVPQLGGVAPRIAPITANHRNVTPSLQGRGIRDTSKRLWVRNSPSLLAEFRATLSCCFWSGRWDSNPRRPAWEAGILPLNYSRSGLFSTPCMIPKIRTLSLASLSSPANPNARHLTLLVAGEMSMRGEGPERSREWRVRRIDEQREDRGHIGRDPQ